MEQVTPKEYLETALAPLPGSDRGTRAKNQIRESITALFPERECFPLVRPVSDEKALQNLDSVPSSQLRPEFRKVAHFPPPPSSLPLLSSGRTSSRSLVASCHA